LVVKKSEPNWIYPFHCNSIHPLLFLFHFSLREKTAEMAVSANELYPVVHDLSETEYATLSNNHRGRSAGGNHKNRPESTLAAAAQDLFTSSLWCGSNDTSNDTRQNYTSRMATTHLASHRMHEHLSAVPRSQSTSPYHPYYNHQQAPSPRSHNKQVVFAGAKSDAPSRQLEDDYVLTQQVRLDGSQRAEIQRFFR
jgi:hypothetical protein